MNGKKKIWKIKTGFWEEWIGWAQSASDLDRVGVLRRRRSDEAEWISHFSADPSPRPADGSSFVSTYFLIILHALFKLTNYNQYAVRDIF